ncbi:oxidoreductase [Pseudomonas hunanensis]|uniref:Oxidoreductase n=1 Tax=Pseudomonas hunanensis TaxID=1247546 RepID=A0ABD6MVG3_9PSED|nr:PDR/VanB family oxidoreductase [Pseudomonas hunanensis]NWL45114.1 oxidoreductase [Pseudomonas hunanensis]
MQRCPISAGWSPKPTPPSRQRRTQYKFRRSLVAEWREVRIESVAQVAEGILDILLCPITEQPLVLAEPGAHIDVRLPNDLIRQYSIHQCHGAGGGYQLGIGLAVPSRGGSSFIHEHFKAGQTVEISAPRNHFGLDTNAPGYVFIAGGIGITPILSMIRWCEVHDKPWQLLYCARNRARAAYYQEIPADRVTLHLDDEHQGWPDLKAFIGQARPGEHLYCCGPAPLMDAVDDVARAVMPAQNIHFERFSAPVADVDSQRNGQDSSFTIALAQSGVEYTVPAQSSVLDVLEAAGVSMPYSCREGLCRTCECTVLEGEVDHRDYVLSDQERDSNQVMLLCVSRARSSKLVLDL